MEKGLSRADQNRQFRQKSHRTLMQEQGHLQHVVEISNKLADLNIPLEPPEVTRLSKAAEVKLKLINKFLPDLKAMELSGELDHNVTTRHRVEFVDNPQDT